MIDTFLIFVAAAAALWLIIGLYDYQHYRHEQYVNRRDWDEHEHRYHHRR